MQPPLVSLVHFLLLPLSLVISLGFAAILFKTSVDNTQNKSRHTASAHDWLLHLCLPLFLISSAIPFRLTRYVWGLAILTSAFAKWREPRADISELSVPEFEPKVLASTDDGIETVRRTWSEIETCLVWLDTHGIKTEGLWQRVGDPNLQEELQTQLLEGRLDMTSLGMAACPLTVAQLTLWWLRQLPGGGFHP